MKDAEGAESTEATVTINSRPAQTWDGGGSDYHWTTATNWSDNAVPVPGDNLVFPAIAYQNLNDYPAGAKFGSVTILGGDYSLTEEWQGIEKALC